MVRHVIIWTLKDEYTPAEKAEIRRGIKEGLEGLLGKVPGLLKIRVEIDGLESSTGDLLLDCLLEDEQALKDYAVHPEHVAVASGKVRPYTKIRSCYDFETDAEG